MKRILQYLGVLLLALAGLVATPGIAQAGPNLIIGSTWDPTEYDNQLAKYSDPGVIQSDGVEIVRVFWAAGSCPTWTDSRIVKLKAHNIIPFISFKDYNLSCMTTLLNTRPADIPIAYFTWFHEGEADMTAAIWKQRQNAMYDTVKAHPSWVQGKVKYMSIATKQWTFIHNAGNYGTYWCGCGDFFAVDMYANSWDAAYPNPDAFLATESNFALSVGKNLFIPELGAKRKPTDPNGTGRRDWINQVMYRANTWSTIRGVLWWDDWGTGGIDLRLDPSTAETSPEAVLWKNILSYN